MCKLPTYLYYNLLYMHRYKCKVKLFFCNYIKEFLWKSIKVKKNVHNCKANTKTSIRIRTSKIRWIWVCISGEKREMSITYECKRHAKLGIGLMREKQSHDTSTGYQPWQEEASY